MINYKEFHQIHRVAPLSEEDFQRIPLYTHGEPIFGHHLYNKELAALGCVRQLYVSAFSRLRWPGLNYDRQPTSEEILSYLRGYFKDTNMPTGGVPTDRYYQESYLSNSEITKFFYRNLWRDPNTGECPVIRWPTWNSVGLPTDGWSNNANWHNDAGNATMALPLHPYAMVELLRKRLDKIPRTPIESVFIDNFNLTFGGNRPWMGKSSSPLGTEFVDAYVESFHMISEMLKARGIGLMINGLLPDQPFWDIPFDSLLLEYGYEKEDVFDGIVEKANGRQIFVTQRLLVNRRDAERVAFNGAKLVSIWPNETRPLSFFPKYPCRWI